jgi:hypothetical protein
LQQRSSAAGPPRDGPDEDQVPVIGKSCYTEVGADRKLTCAPTPIARKEIKSKKRAKTFPEARNGGPSGNDDDAVAWLPDGRIVRRCVPGYIAIVFWLTYSKSPNASFVHQAPIDGALCTTSEHEVDCFSHPVLRV